MATTPKLAISPLLVADIEKVFRSTVSLFTALGLTDHTWTQASTGAGTHKDKCLNAIKEFFRIIDLPEAELAAMTDKLLPNIARDMRKKYDSVYADHDYTGFFIKIPKATGKPAEG